MNRPLWCWALAGVLFFHVCAGAQPHSLQASRPAIDGLTEQWSDQLAGSLWQSWLREAELRSDAGLPYRLLATQLNALSEDEAGGAEVELSQTTTPKKHTHRSLLKLAALVLGFIGSTLWMLIITAPLTSATNAATAPVVKPVIEKIRQLGQASFGAVSLPLTRRLNRKRTTTNAESQGGRIVAGHRAIHNTNFGGMTVAEQEQNLAKLQEIWAQLELRYGQVFTDTLRQGRNHLENILGGELSSAESVQNLNSAIAIRSMRAEQVIHRLTGLHAPDRQATEAIHQSYSRFLVRHSPTHLAELAPSALEARRLQSEKDLRDLGAWGLSPWELGLLRQMAEEIQELLLTKAVVLCIQNLIDFGRPEGNRNAHPGVQVLWSAVRRFTGLQRETDSVAPLVAEMQEILGLKTSSELKPAQPQPQVLFDCIERFLEEKWRQLCQIFSPQTQQDDKQALARADALRRSDQLKEKMLNDPYDPLFGWLSLITEPSSRSRIAERLSHIAVASPTTPDLVGLFLSSLRECS